MTIRLYATPFWKAEPISVRRSPTIARMDRTSGSTAVFRRSADAAAQLKIIATSARIPNDVFAVRPGLPAETTGKLKHLLMNLGADPEGKALLTSVFKADSFTDVDVSDFGFAATARSE